jgi:nucleotide sugar dehydrogenase
LGTTRNIVRPILESNGKKFQLAFCPERTIEGQAMMELRYLPQIIGADSQATALRATQIFQFITPTVVRVTDFETAEMIKLVDNTKRDVMFAYANEVARLCDAVGVSAEEVISSGRFGYSRTDLPMPGPVGGPCLSKDPYILAESVAAFGLTPEITLTARHVNERQFSEVVSFLKSYSRNMEGFPKNPTIALLGVAFKGQPATDDVRGTTAVPILEELRKAFPGSRFVGYDPVVAREAIASLGLLSQATLTEAMTGAHLALILNNHSEFSRMPIESLAAQMSRPAAIYDFWNCFTRTALSLPAGVRYLTLGSHGLAQRAT